MSSDKVVGNVTNIIDPTPESQAPTLEKKEEESETKQGAESSAPAEAPIGRVRRHGRSDRLDDSKKDLRLMIAVLGALFFVFIIAVQYWRSAAPTLVGSEANQSADGLYYTMRISNHHIQGEPIALLMSITNTSGFPQTLDFGADTKVDFVVQQQLDVFFEKIPVEVWRYSKDKGALGKQRKMTIMPNEERIFSVFWDQTDNKGQKVGQGRYIITGEINTPSGSMKVES